MPTDEVGCGVGRRVGRKVVRGVGRGVGHHTSKESLGRSSYTPRILGVIIIHIEAAIMAERKLHIRDAACTRTISIIIIKIRVSSAIHGQQIRHEKYALEVSDSDTVQALCLRREQGGLMPHVT